MLTLIISILISIACVIAAKVGGISTGSTVSSGLAGFILPNVIIGIIVRKKVGAVNNELQEIVTGAQKRINQTIHQFQYRPGGDPKRMQKQIERDQHATFQRALDFTANMEPFKKWNILMAKQISTIRLQFLYQLNEFAQVDEIFSKGYLSSPMMLEPMPVAMKMSRQFKNKDFEGAEKTFKRHIIWFRGRRGTLLYALMSWIHMKQGEPEKARQLLAKGKDATGSEVLANNFMQLSNDKNNKFSNAELGDEWFGLYLEKPPTPKQKRMRQPKGGRRF